MTGELRRDYFFQVGGRLAVTVAGRTLSRWSAATVSRDLKNVAGQFEFSLIDEARQAAAGPVTPDWPKVRPVGCGDRCTITIDDEPVLIGRIERVGWRSSARRLEFSIAGRDLCGDLVGCAACPTGPAEFSGLTLTQVAEIICRPFGIKVRAEVDVGAPFARLAVNPHMTAMALLESGARQRAVLLVSDGVGTLVLTRGGNSRAAEALAVGRNVHEVSSTVSWEHRFSDVWVKGQSAHGGGTRAGGHAPATVPLAGAPTATPPAPATPPASGGNAGDGVVMTGHARDPEITRWRPHVRMARTQSGGSSLQEQAEWAVRVARGEGDHLAYTVEDWRGGADERRLWRPNEVTPVYDPAGGIDAEKLIAGVAYKLTDAGAFTELRVVGRTAYDRIMEAERQHGHHGRGHGRNGGGAPATVPLSPPPSAGTPR